MIIPINDTYRINSDSYQWKVEKFSHIIKSGEDIGKERWKALTYHGELDKAVQRCAERMIRETDCTGIAEAEKAVERIAATLKEAIGDRLNISVVISRVEL